MTPPLTTSPIKATNDLAPNQARDSHSFRVPDWCNGLVLFAALLVLSTMKTTPRQTVAIWTIRTAILIIFCVCWYGSMAAVVMAGLMKD